MEMRKEGNGQTCCEINPYCQVRKLDQAELKNHHCPARDQKKGCWEIDWASELRNKPESEKEFWKGFYNVGCRDCPVYEHHQEKIEEMVDSINSI